MLISWDKKFEIGIEKIDSQHKKLVELTRELTEATQEGRGRRIIVDVLKELISYTKTHFVDEEKLMKEIGFPEYEEHKKEHEEFIREVYADCAEFLEGHSIPTLRLTDFLSNWLIDHILIHDKRIGKFMNSMGS